MDHRTPKQRRTDRICNSLIFACVVVLGFALIGSLDAELLGLVR